MSASGHSRHFTVVHTISASLPKADQVAALLFAAGGMNSAVQFIPELSYSVRHQRDDQ
jgi:hypothetical protein